MKQTLLIAAFAALLTVPARALDKEALIDHIKETYPLPPGVELELGDPKPSKIPSFNKIVVTFRAGPGAQTETLYISQDGRHYILGEFKDLKIHPDNVRLKGVSLKDVAARGPKKAKVLIVEWTDFQCYFCQKGYRIMRDKIMKDYKGKVRWVYKSLPLNQIHPWAESAAVAVECAKKQGNAKLWKLHDVIFDNQSKFTTAKFDEQISKYAAKVGLNQKKFLACYDKRETLKRVITDAQEAGNLGISGTPAFLINGHLIGGADYQKIKAIIDESLAGKHGKI